MADPEAAIGECIRVLAPRGVICVMEPTAALLERARAQFPDHPDAKDPTPYAQGMTVTVRHTPMFDIYEIRA